MNKENENTINIFNAEATILNLSKGDSLAVTIKSDFLDHISIQALKESLQEKFPLNQVLVFGIGQNDNIDFTVVKNKTENSCSTSSYCSGCSCGKKEQVEAKSLTLNNVDPTLQRPKELVDVSSSTIKQVGFNEDSSTLEILFQGGSTYIYKKVPKEVYEGIFNAESVGKYFIANIKNNYEYVRLGVNK